MSSIPFKVASQTRFFKLSKLLSDKIPANSARDPGTEIEKKNAILAITRKKFSRDFTYIVHL